MQKDENENVNRVAEEQCSVKLSMNAKEQLSGECKSYAFTVEEAYEKAQAVMDKIETKIREKNSPKM